jgi:positive control factor
MKKLLMEYKKSLKAANRSEKKLLEEIKVSNFEKDKEKTTSLESDLSVVRGMIRDLEYAIEWMTTAKEPGTYKGIQHRKAYEHKCMPPEFFTQIPSQEPMSDEAANDIKQEAIDFLLADLTGLEKDIYLLVKGNNHSQSSAARLLNISRSNASSKFKKAEEKVQNRSRFIK